VADTTAVGSRPETLLRVLMLERNLTREQTLDVLERRALHMGIKDFALSLRQLDRWLAREVGDPRASRCRVAEAEFGYPIQKLLSLAHLDGSIVLHRPRCDLSPLEHFDAIIAHLVDIDHEQGPRSALEPAASIYRTILASARGLTGRDRRQHLRLAAHCSELVGWLHQDAGLTAEAREWTMQALDLAEAGEAYEMTPYILMRRSAIAADLRLCDEALLLAERAVRHSRDGVDLALAHRDLAMAHALKGDSHSLRRSVDEALDSLTSAGRNQALAPYCSASFIKSEAGAAALVAGEAHLAVYYLEPAALNWPAGQARDKAICFARLALAHAQLRDLEKAAAAALNASNAAAGCNSARFGTTFRAAAHAIKEQDGGRRAAELAKALLSLP
jgi:hypothetical protein